MEIVNHMKIKVMFYGVLLIMLISTQNSYAYLDPGSGSYLIQIIISLLLGILFSLIRFMKNIKTFIMQLFKKRSYKNDNDFS